MEHIIIECDHPARELIWELVERMWSMKYTDRIDISWGVILAATSSNFQVDGDTRPDRAKNYIFQVLVLESAHLIWKLRCERVIQYLETKEALAISNRWLAAINARLMSDQACIKGLGSPRRGLEKKLVLDAWSAFLEDKESLSLDWSREAGVLVGISDFSR
jgi:hypothetical protein